MIMSRAACLSGFSRFVLAVLVLTWGMSEARAQDSKLPGTVLSRVKKIRASLDQAVKALEADRLPTAQRKLKEAQRVLAEIEKRYAGKFSVDDPAYKSMMDRLAEVTGKIEAAAGAAQATADEANKAREENEALCKTWVDKLGPFVDRRSELFLPIGAELNRASEEEQAKSREAYLKAKALFEEYKKVTFPQGKTRELKNVESSLTSSLKYYDQTTARDEQTEACQEWVDQLAPFADVGSGSRKLLIASATANPEEIKARQTIYEEAKAIFEKYQKAEFPLGKTERLKNLEEELKKRLEEFPKAMAQSMAMVSGDVGKRMDGMLAYLERNKDWQNDKTKKPPTIMERDLKPLREEIQRLAANNAVDEAGLTALKTKLDAIVKKDEEHRRIRSERTFQMPDRYQGADIEKLKAKAVEVIGTEQKDAKVLRHRITRSVRAQLAVKRADGKVYLQEVYVGQDKQGDATWGPLKGHTTWADWMAEGNVGKEMP
jgi:hypothetical protein